MTPKFFIYLAAVMNLATAVFNGYAWLTLDEAAPVHGTLFVIHTFAALVFFVTGLTTDKNGRRK